MHFKKISTFLQYIHWLRQRYAKQRPTHSNYRISSIKNTQTGQFIVTAQIINTAIFLELNPSDIILNNSELEKFSKKDIRTLTCLASEQAKQPKYKIVMQEFCATFDRILFRVKNSADNTIETKTADQLTLDNKLINNLSPQDVKSISYTAGYEHSLMEKISSTAAF